MGRYIGPVCKLCRRAGDKLMLKGDRCFTPKCGVDKRPKPPGQTANQRRRVSDRALQLKEKQKARRIYGLLERQFKRTFAEAERRPGPTGDNLRVLLELRLDNVVYRLGFADSRPQARQVVRYGHITLNGRRASSPSLLVKENDVVGWTVHATKTEYVKMLVKNIESKHVVAWLSLDRQNLTGKVVSLPAMGDIEAKFVGQTIVEYYSR